jgi:hypothetical protein
LLLVAIVLPACNDFPDEVLPDPDIHWWAGFDANGMTDRVVTLAEYRGELVAGGYFLRAGGRDVFGVARWGGDSWQPLLRGVRRHDCSSSFCTAQVLTLLPFGTDLIAGGHFTAAGGERAICVASWDGSLWHPMAEGLDDDVLALTEWRGQLVAAGEFERSGSSPVSHVAVWNGQEWASLHCESNRPVRFLATYGQDLVAAGNFTSINGIQMSNVARWDGSAWRQMGDIGIGSVVYGLANLDDELYAIGYFHFDQTLYATGCARWNGDSWEYAAGRSGGFDLGWAAGTFQGDLVVAANLNETPGPSDRISLVRRRGATWEVMSTPVKGPVAAIRSWGGHMFVGGTFDHAGDRPSHFIARWDE